MNTSQGAGVRVEELMAGVGSAQRLLDDQELMRRLMARYTLKECAALFNVTYHTICRRARRPEFLQALRELDQEMFRDVDSELRAMSGMMTERIVEVSSKALEKLEQLLDNDGTDERLVARIAMDFLDRNPETSKTTKHIGTVKHSYADPKQLQHAALAAAEMDENHFAPTLEGEYN